MEDSALTDLGNELRRLFELAILIGQTGSGEEELEKLVGHLEDAKKGIGQTLLRQNNSPVHRQEGEDYFIPEWLGDLYTHLIKDIERLSSQNRTGLDRLQKAGVGLDAFPDQAIRMGVAIAQKYARAEVDKVQAEYEQRESASRQSSPLLQAAMSAGYVERNGRYQFTQQGVEQISNTGRALLLFDTLGKDEISIDDFIQADLIHGYNQRKYQQNLMRNLLRPGKRPPYVESVKREEGFFYRRTAEGEKHAMEVIQRPGKRYRDE